jgi:hypothetical protein
MFFGGIKCLIRQNVKSGRNALPITAPAILKHRHGATKIFCRFRLYNTGSTDLIKKPSLLKNLVNEFVPVVTPGIMINSTAPIVIRFGNISVDVSDGCHPETLRNVLEALGTYA